MRKLTVIMLALLMVLSSATMAMAAPFDLIKADGSETHSFIDFIDSPSIFDEVANNMTEYLIEDSNGQLFRVSEVQDSLDAGAETLADAVVGLTPVEINEELTVESVSAITDVKTKVTTVTATVLNAEEDAEATVAIFAYDEDEEEYVEDAVVELDVEIDEDGNIEVEVDAVEKELDSGDYKVVVTVTQVVEEEEVTAEGEFEFELDFEAVDALVAAVNNAGSSLLKLDAALSKFEGYDYELINAYNEAIDSYLEENELDEFQTVAQVEDFINKVHEDLQDASDVEIFQATLVAEYKKGEVSFARFLDANYDNVVLDDEHLDDYVGELFDIVEGEDDEEDTITAQVSNHAEAQLAIDVVNFDIDLGAAQEAVGALFVERKLVDEVKKLDEIKAMVNALVDPAQEEDAEENADVVALKDEIENIENILAARDAVFGLIGEDEDDNPVLLANQAAIDAAQDLVDEIDEDYIADITELQDIIDAAQNMLDLQNATAAVHALFVDVDADEKELAPNVGQDEITAAEDLLDELEITGSELNTLVDNAQELFNSIKARLEINSAYIVSNPSYKEKGRQLGYWVQISLNKGDDNDDFTVADTEDITIELYNGDKLLGVQSLNSVGYEKYADLDTLGGTINVFGEYKATSWDHEWLADTITEIPTQAKAIVKYKDGRTVETTANVNVSNKMKFFAAAVTEANTATEMRNALVNFVAESGNGYLMLTNAVKLEVAELVLDAIANDIEEDSFTFADADYVNDKLTAAMVLHGEKLALITGIGADATTVDVEEALSEFEYEAYDAFTNYADRLAIAENFFNNLEFEESELVTEFTTLQQIVDAIDAAIAGL